MKTINGGVTKAKGFKANGMACGIKRSGKPDLALIYSETPCVAAGAYTKNSIIAAPLVVTKENLRDSQAQAVICNSGNANCFTGNFGLIYARRSAELVGKLLNMRISDVIVASTGIIGKPLPFQKIAAAAEELVEGLSTQKGHAAAQAILTTDLATKEIAVEITVGGKKVTIGACSKGSGMIQPNMATMLCFITTDCAIAVPLLKKALKDAVAKTFNCITVDGCMSTNDMVTVMANGLAGNRPINKTGEDYNKFSQALYHVCLDMAKKIVIDGEGATKFLEIHVTGAATESQAHKAALAIANSNLVKTAAYGSNPNWGRVAGAVGSLGIPKVTERDLKIKFTSFAHKNIRISVDLNLGKKQAVVYTCDLSLDYVKINGKYS